MSRNNEMHICLGSSCFSRGNKEVSQFIRDYIRRNHLEDRIVFKGARCMGRCSNGPNMRINEVIREGITIVSAEAQLEEIQKQTNQSGKEQP